MQVYITQRIERSCGLQKQAKDPNLGLFLFLQSLTDFILSFTVFWRWRAAKVGIDYMGFFNHPKDKKE